MMFSALCSTGSKPRSKRLKCIMNMFGCILPNIHEAISTVTDSGRDVTPPPIAEIMQIHSYIDIHVSVNGHNGES